MYYSKKIIFKFTSQALLVCVFCVLPPQPLQAEPKVYGWLESIYLHPSRDRIVTKLDTGAKTSSIYAKNITSFVKDGKPWVRFLIPGKENNGYSIEMEKPVLRKTRVKRHIGESISRYVVELDFCLGGKFYRSEFTLANRGNFNYRVILGRRMMQGHLLVDPSKKFTAGKACKKMFDTELTN